MFDHTELVADLGPAEHHGVGPFGRLGESIEHLELFGDEETGSGGQQFREVVDTRLLAVHDAEAVGHERIPELCELAGECAAFRIVLRGLTRIEAQVLDHGDVTVFEGGDRIMSRLADGVACEGDGLAEQLGQALRDRREAVGGVGLAAGAAQVRAHHEACSLVDESVERRQGCPHTTIVRDDPVPQRDVQITTDDDALACERTQVVEGAQCHGVDQSFEATSSVRSTRRFE